jgi:hypothetical protein
LDVLQLNIAKSKAFLETWSLQISLLQASKDEDYATLPNFEVQGQDMLDKSGARVASFCPVVTLENRWQWEDYAIRNQEWIAESLRAADGSGELTVATGVSEFIHRKSHQNATEPLYQDLYLPVWQTVPIVGNQDTINFDMFSHSFLSKAYDRMLESSESVMYQQTEYDEDDSKDRLDVIVGTPIYYGSPSEGSSTVIFGVMVAVVPWESLLASLVPPDTPPITMVVENPCTESLSFEIVDGSAVFLGNGDRYIENVAVSEEVSAKLIGFQGVDGCESQFSMYPSQSFQDEATSHLPWIYAVSAVGLFLLTAFTFYAHDVSFRRRQQKYIKAASLSNEIVSSLFPDGIRSRLIAEQHSMPGSEKDSDRSVSEATDEETPSEGFSRGNKPIADLFPHASVCFMDIAGFTAWSSSREPTQVFTLLESIYSSFDKIATRTKVFKVETVGDSYVAATGLPDRMTDHAGKSFF